MLLVFVSMLPSAPVRVYVSPNWQHFLAKMEWAFILTCMLLFTQYTNQLDCIIGYFGIVVIAPLVGLSASTGLTALFLRGLPEPKISPTKERFVDSLFDWSKEAVEYKIKRLMVPYACGICIAVILHKVLT